MLNDTARRQIFPIASPTKIQRLIVLVVPEMGENHTISYRYKLHKLSFKCNKSGNG